MGVLWIVLMYFRLLIFNVCFKIVLNWILLLILKIVVLGINFSRFNFLKGIWVLLFIFVLIFVFELIIVVDNCE